MVELRVLTAEGGLVLDLLLSWKTMSSSPPWPQSWEVTGALGPGKAHGTEGSQFALVIGKETVFSGRWHWTEG